MSIDYTSLAELAFGLVLLLLLATYSLKILSNFRKGMLERGWKHVAFGSVFLIIAQALLLLAQIGAPGMESLLSMAGSGIRFLAIIFLIVGLREHYLVWRVEKKSEMRSSVHLER